MIGDADGYTSRSVRVSIDNPHTEKYCRLLNKLKPCPGKWAVMLDWEHLMGCFKDKQITLEEFKFLERLMFGPDKKTNRDEFSDEFYEGVETYDWMYLIFQGVELFYVDDERVKHSTNIKPGVK
jgi:hypothetical protein